MPTHRLDRWMREHHLWLRIALLVLAAGAALALLTDHDGLAGILSIPVAVLVTLVMLYLPRTRL